jgi:hypothetical protein
VKLCRLPTDVHGAHSCPRQWRHDGPCYWWLEWKGEDSRWHVMVYSGLAEDRRKRCKGTFAERPTAPDVHGLLKVVSTLKKRQVARRTPQSEPEPVTLPVRYEFSPFPGGCDLRPLVASAPSPT